MAKKTSEQVLAAKLAAAREQLEDIRRERQRQIECLGLRIGASRAITRLNREEQIVMNRIERLENAG